MHILDLNLDVVHTMLSYVERKDMLPLATTCTSLYEPVMQHRLAHINTGSFTKRENLRKYCDYMLCDARRPRYLASVVISLGPKAPAGDTDSYREAELFAQIIRHTARLTAVKCCMQLDESQAAPFLLDAITSITTLTSIELALHYDDMLRVLSSLKSDPYRLGCCFWSPRQGVESGVPIPRLLDQLAAFSHLHTLELELAEASFFPLERGTPDEVTTLPSVRELTLVQPTPLNLHLVARVFPNVETLYLSQPPDTNEPQVPSAWPSVDYLSTNCAVAVTSHVRHVSVAASPRCTQSSIAMLHRLLPSVMECNVDRAYLQAVALLPQPVRFLQLRIAASLNEGLQQYLDDYLAILKEVPLVGLALMLPASLKSDADHACSIRAVCTWMAGCVPSLSCVGIAWFTYSRKANRAVVSSSWFEVTARPECHRPSLVALSESEEDALYARLLGTVRRP